jgi:large subunit ribosomal protein L1
MSRGKRYQEAIAKVEPGKTYSLTEAIKLAKATSYTTFNGSIELHIPLMGRKPEDRQIRAQIHFPYSIGKLKQVAILTEKLIEEIAKSERAPADIYLATPELMPQVAKIAKILGPKGKMPDPKSGTVTEKLEERQKELAAGNVVELRTDPSGIIHTSIGKVSWEENKLLSNAEAVLKIARPKIGSVTLSATMGPGIKVAFH